MHVKYDCCDTNLRAEGVHQALSQGIASQPESNNSGIPGRQDQRVVSPEILFVALSSRGDSLRQEHEIGGHAKGRTTY
jgi:hypothetical protein